MWEVFRPQDGKPQFKTRFKLVAWLLSWFYWMDYAKPGEGWCR